jgi:hypothetical protein
MAKVRKNNQKSREKGIPVPNVSINEAIGFIRKVYDSVGDRAMSFDETMSYMNVPTAYGRVFVKVFKDYGLMEQIEGGFWKISELGIKCLNGDYKSIKESFERVQIFAQLMIVFGKGKFTQKTVVDYLKNKYHKPVIYVKNTAEKFWSGKEYLESVERGGEVSPELEISLDSVAMRKILKIIQLKYAFDPPNHEEIVDLVDDIYEEFKDDENPAIRTLVESMKENENKEEYLILLFENLKKVLSERYPSLANYKEKKQKTSEKENIDVDKKLSE